MPPQGTLLNDSGLQVHVHVHVRALDLAVPVVRLAGLGDDLAHDAAAVIVEATVEPHLEATGLTHGLDADALVAVVGPQPGLLLGAERLVVGTGQHLPGRELLGLLGALLHALDLPGVLSRDVLVLPGGDGQEHVLAQGAEVLSRDGLAGELLVHLALALELHVHVGEAGGVGGLGVGVGVHGALLSAGGVGEGVGVEGHAVLQDSGVP